MLSIVNEIFICFVSDYYQIVFLSKLGNCLCFIASEHDASGILRCVVINRFRFLSSITCKSLLESRLASLCSWNEYETTLTVRRQVFDWCPIRRKGKYLIGRLNHCRECAEQTLHSSVDDNHIAFVSGDVVSASEFVSDCCAQFGNTRRGCIARFVFFQRLRHCFLDRIRSEHERFTTLELEDSRTLSAQFHYPVSQFDDVRKPYFVEPRSETQVRWRGSHCLGSFPSE